MNQFRAITCPNCANRKDTHLWCDVCYGSRIITLRERSQPVTFKLWHLFAGGALLGLAAWWVFTKIYEAVSQ